MDMRQSKLGHCTRRGTRPWVLEEGFLGEGCAKTDLSTEKASPQSGLGQQTIVNGAPIPFIPLLLPLLLLLPMLLELPPL